MTIKMGEIYRNGRGSFHFLCKSCGEHFVDLQEILNHIDDHFNDDDSQMDDNKISMTTSMFNEQSEPLPNSDIYVDEIDQEDKKSSMNLKSTHKELEELNQRKEMSLKTELTEDYPIECPICNINCTNSISFRMHKKDVHGISGTIFQCYICRIYCKNFQALLRHIESVYHSKPNWHCYFCQSPPAIMNFSDQRQHKCFFCKCWYDDHKTFSDHFKNEHNKDVDEFFKIKSNCNEFTCYVCKKDFSSKPNLSYHLKVHNDKLYICDVCGNRYRTLSILNKHSNVHEGKTYTCEDCGKTFNYYARLRVHKIVHRKDLNYKCDVCSKAFKAQKYLTRHKIVHSDEKRFSCRYCEKRFTFSTGRRTHEVSQHKVL